MSAEIIQFIPRPKHEHTDFPTIVFRSVVPDDLVTRRTDDTAPCEYVQPDWYEK